MIIVIYFNKSSEIDIKSWKEQCASFKKVQIIWRTSDSLQKCFQIEDFHHTFV